ncbi:ABC transporter ATPase [Lutibacter holmesii]|uniref:ABC transporter ATPase n=1 Tax=Lutibacter holmesii TaxID=1137985 RepID=A0ABW3WU74_9FLAO
MIVDFDKIPEWSKLWVYPSSRKFYPQEIEGLKNSIEEFLTNWSAKEEAFDCAYEIKYNRFILIAVDNSDINLSLKSHDALVAFILSLEVKYNIVLLDKINVCYKQGEFVQYKDLIEFKKMIKTGGVSKKTTVFDNMITSKDALENDWEINITDSWLSRYLK